MTKQLVAIGNRDGVTAVALDWQELEATRLAALARRALAGPLAELERQNMAAIEGADLADLEATQQAASDRWGW